MAAFKFRAWGLGFRAYIYRLAGLSVPDPMGTTKELITTLPTNHLHLKP